VAPSDRIIRTRRAVPDGRALVGGLLVGLAAIGTWWFSVGAGTPVPPDHVVALRPITPGHRIEAADLTVRAIDLPRSVDRQAFTRPDQIVGLVALAPLDAGALVQSAGLAPATGGSRSREVSFAVENEWAVGGAVRPGDRIDVFATDDRSHPATTREVLHHALVRRADATGSSSLGDHPGQTITVAVDDADRLLETVTAIRADKVTVVRATGALASEANLPGTTTTTTSTSTTTTTRPRSRKGAGG